MHKSASSSSLSYLRPIRKIDKPTFLAASGGSFLAKPSRATLFCLPTWETLQISNTPFRSRRDRPGIFVERSPCCFQIGSLPRVASLLNLPLLWFTFKIRFFCLVHIVFSVFKKPI